jgi:hypothetical protein
MVRDAEIRIAVENARSLLGDHGYECRTTVEDFLLWFQADTPYDQGGEFDCVIQNPLLVAHELVEIENVRAMGLKLTKDVIVKNMQKVDDAHLKAARVEIELAFSLGNTQHVRERIVHVGMWIEDPSVSPGNKEQYRELREKALKTLTALEDATVR